MLAPSNTARYELNLGLAVKHASIKDFPLRRSGRATPEQGYRLSSDELNSGLEVDAVSITSLPEDLVSELLRLRRCWGPAAGAVPDSRWLP